MGHRCTPLDCAGQLWDAGGPDTRTPRPDRGTGRTGLDRPAYREAGPTMTPDSRARLDALGTVLRAHGLTAWMTPDGLHVENPDADGCCTPHPCAVLLAEARGDDGGRLWYVTSYREPLAEADRVTDAVMAVRSLLGGAGVSV